MLGQNPAWRHAPAFSQSLVPISHFQKAKMSSLPISGLLSLPQHSPNLAWFSWGQSGCSNGVMSACRQRSQSVSEVACGFEHEFRCPIVRPPWADNHVRSPQNIASGHSVDRELKGAHGEDLDCSFCGCRK